MASDIKTSHLCCLSAALVFDTTSPSAKACAAGTGSVGRSSEPQLASLRHGRLTPARISPGCPPCLRLGLGRSIIIPDGVIAKQPATGCFVDGWTRLAPYLAVFDAGFVCTGGLGASSSVAGPGQGAPSGKYPDGRIFDFRGATSDLSFFGPHFLLGTFFGFDNQHF